MTMVIEKKIIYQFLFGEIQLIFIFNFTVLQVYSKSKDTQPKSPATEICRLHLCVVQACWQCWTVFHHLPLFLYCFLRLTFEHFTSKQFPLFWPSSLEFSAETQAVIFFSPKDKSTTLKNDCKLWLASWNEVSEENLSCQKPSTVVQTGLKMFNRKQRKNTHYLHFPWFLVEVHFCPLTFYDPKYPK